MATCKINLADLITQEAQNQGVDPGVALAVARTESGVCQWNADGSVVTSSAGAIGVMQLEPATAAALGVDPYDVNQNIRGGVTYLKQLFQKYGSWDKALAAYNWGPAKVDTAAAAGTSWPSEVVNYVKGILGIGAVYNAGLSKSQGSAGGQPGIATSDLLAGVISPPATVTMGAVLVIGGVLLGVYLLSD